MPLYHSLPFHALSAFWWPPRVGPVAPHFERSLRVSGGHRE